MEKSKLKKGQFIVKIIKATDSMIWYANRIGEKFTVVSCNSMRYETVEKVVNYPSHIKEKDPDTGEWQPKPPGVGGIMHEDCVVVSEIENKTSWQKMKDTHSKMISELYSDIDKLIRGNFNEREQVILKHGVRRKMSNAFSFGNATDEIPYNYTGIYNSIVAKKPGNRREAEYAHGLLNKISTQPNPVPIGKRIQDAIYHLRIQNIEPNVLNLTPADFHDFHKLISSYSKVYDKNDSTAVLDIVVFCGMKLHISVEPRNVHSFIGRCAVKDDPKTHYEPVRMFYLDNLKEL